jgi:hypothetical protein
MMALTTRGVSLFRFRDSDMMLCSRRGGFLLCNSLHTGDRNGSRVNLAASAGWTGMCLKHVGLNDEDGPATSQAMPYRLLPVWDAEAAAESASFWLPEKEQYACRCLHVIAPPGVGAIGDVGGDGGIPGRQAVE